MRKISQGSHAVLFYNSPREKYQLILPFIKDGLDKGEAILYLLDEKNQKRIMKYMMTFGINVHRHEKSGALKILASENWYVEKGTISKELVVKKWMKTLSDATKNGFHGLRVSGEPTYFFRHDLMEPWMEYERSLPRKFESPITAICRYKTADLASNNMNYLLELVKIHSHAITSKSIQEIDFQTFFLEAVDRTFKSILGESGTHAVYYFLESKYSLPKSNIGGNLRLFSRALDSLLGLGGNVLQKELVKTVCSKLGITP